MVGWSAAILFTIVGIYMIVRREEATKGLSLSLGGRVFPGCSIVVGIVFFLLAAIFFLYLR